MAGKAYFNNKQQIATAFYNGILISKGYSNEIVTFDGNLVTLTINPTPSDATITFSNYGIGEISSDGKSIRIKKGTEVSYIVSKEHYKPINNTIVVQSTILLQIQMSLDTILNVEDYEYTSDSNDNIILTNYIGVNANVIAPELTI